VVQEALSNVVRHARASKVEIAIDVGSSTVVLRVDDDGEGIADQQTRRSGLVNLAERASRHEGEMRLEPAATGGTRLTWTARLPGGPAPG